MGPSWGAGDDPNPTLLQAAPRTDSAVTAELSCHLPPAPPHSTVSQGWCIGSTPSRPQTQRMHLRSVMGQSIPSTALSETPNTITSPRPHGDPPSRHIPRASQRPHIPSCLQAPVETPPSHHIPRASWRPLIPSCPQVLIETSHPIMSPSPRGDPPHPIAPPEPHGDPTSHHTPKPFWRPPPPNSPPHITPNPPPPAPPISSLPHPMCFIRSPRCFSPLPVISTRLHLLPNELQAWGLLLPKDISLRSFPHGMLGVMLVGSNVPFPHPAAALWSSRSRPRAGPRGRQNSSALHNGALGNRNGSQVV